MNLINNVQCLVPILMNYWIMIIKNFKYHKRPNGFIEVKLDKYPYVDFIRLWKSNLIKIKNK